MKTNILSQFIGVAAATTFLVPAALAQVSVKPGTKAPPLKVAEWIKGTSFKGYKKGQFYVFEFWATWCGPCVSAMPHLSKLAKQYKGRVDFYGVDVWERGNNVPKLVRDFVKKQGDKMAYNVARDDAKGTVANAWLKAAGQNGIPASFLVNGEGTILWIGHPMGLDPILEKAVAGKFDVQDSRKKFEVDQQKMVEVEKVMRIPEEALKLHREGKAEEALKMIDEGKARAGKLKEESGFLLPYFEAARLTVLYKGDPASVDTEVDKLMGDRKDRVTVMLMVQSQTRPGGDKEFGLHLVRKLREKLPVEEAYTFEWLTVSMAGAELGLEPQASIDDLEKTKKLVKESKEFKEFQAQTLKELDDRIAKVKKKMGG